MGTIINAWLSVWLYVMATIGIVLAIRIWKNRRVWDRINILCALAIIVLILHVIEEWVLPGGLHYSYNIAHGSTLLSRYPMNRLTDMITNFGAVVLGCVVLKVWASANRRESPSCFFPHSKLRYMSTSAYRI